MLRARPLLVFAAAQVAACGARSGLLVPRYAADADVGVEIAIRGDTDVQDVAAIDAIDVLDAVDATDTSDVVSEDVPADVPRDAPTPCAEGTENVFVIGTAGELYSFDPSVNAARFIAVVPCAAAHQNFNSMAVARDGTAYAAAWDNSLVRISTVDGSCSETAFADSSFGVFCMGFALRGIDDVLFISSCHEPVDQLGSIDTTTFALTTIGALAPQPAGGSELTGDRHGRLFGFWDDTGGIGTGQIDPSNATLSGVARLPFRDFMDWAFAEWGGDFFFFADGTNGSDVIRYHPADGSYSIVAHIPIDVVGAGVSTCAPG